MQAFFGAGMVQAAETEGPAETEGTVTQVQPLDKLPADIAAAIEKLNQQNQLILLKRIRLMRKLSLKILEKYLQKQLKLQFLRKKQHQNQLKLQKKKQHQ